jgi:hypothetical protein
MPDLQRAPKDQMHGTENQKDMAHTTLVLQHKEKRGNITLRGYEMLAARVSMSNQGLLLFIDKLSPQRTNECNHTSVKPE